MAARPATSVTSTARDRRASKRHWCARNPTVTSFAASMATPMMTIAAGAPGNSTIIPLVEKDAAKTAGETATAKARKLTKAGTFARQTRPATGPNTRGAATTRGAGTTAVSVAVSASGATTGSASAGGSGAVTTVGTRPSGGEEAATGSGAATAVGISPGGEEATGSGVATAAGISPSARD